MEGIVYVSLTGTKVTIKSINNFKSNNFTFSNNFPNIFLRKINGK